MNEQIQEMEQELERFHKRNQSLELKNKELLQKLKATDKELKKQIEPRENEIKAMNEQIQEMEQELERFHKKNQSLELKNKELLQKLKATDKELKSERQRVQDTEAILKRFRTDIHHTAGLIQEPKQLKESVISLYKKHVGEDTPESAAVDQDIQQEYSRQREHLERSVASLRKKLLKDTEIHRADNVRIMQENVTLIREINDLRRELKIARTQVHDLEVTLKVSQKGGSPIGVGAERFGASAVELTDSAEKERIIDIQRAEIRKLRSQVQEYESRVSRPGSGGRLPPVTAPVQAVVAH
jgi:DNA repair exonuclease SbcCD ATPase subunit